MIPPLSNLSNTPPPTDHIQRRTFVIKLEFSTPPVFKVHCSINGLENSSSPEYSKVQHFFGSAVELFSIGVELFSVGVELGKKFDSDRKSSTLIEISSTPIEKSSTPIEKSSTLTKKEKNMFCHFPRKYQFGRNKY